MRNHIKSMVGVTCDVVLKAPGEVPRSQGKAVRVKDMRQAAASRDAEDAAEEQLILVDETQPRHRLRRQDRRSSRRAAASRLLDLHRRRARTDRCSSSAARRNITPADCGRTPAAAIRVRASGRSSAAQRRLGEELGVDERSVVRLLRALPEPSSTTACTRTNSSTSISGGSEVRAEPDPDEIADVAFLSLDDIGRRMQARPGCFTVWFRHYFQHHHGRDRALCEAGVPLIRERRRSHARRRSRATCSTLRPACSP